VSDSYVEGYLQFPANSLKGVQPEFLEQLSQTFTKYVVHGSAIQITFHPITTKGALSSVPLDVVVIPIATALKVPTFAKLATMDSSRSLTVKEDCQLIQASCSTIEVLGVKNLDSDVALHSRLSNGPTKQCHWLIAARPSDGKSLANLAVSVRITFDCEFLDRKVACQSPQSHQGRKHLSIITENKGEDKSSLAPVNIHKVHIEDLVRPVLQRSSLSPSTMLSIVTANTKRVKDSHNPSSPSAPSRTAWDEDVSSSNP
jgi:hypothetical protein